MRVSIPLSWLALSLINLTPSLCLANEQTSRPNLVFIIADDCTFRDLGCYGGQADTPNIDGIAKEGIQMTRCFQAAPMCSPTRHNIYTGLYPVRSGAYPNHTFVKKGTQSIVQYLEPLGYRVALSGKTHIAPKDHFPFEYSGVGANPDMKVIDQLMTESNETGTPFCLFACSNEPHSPWNKGDASKYPPAKVELPPYLADTDEVRENFSRYLAEITYYDSQVGEILALIDKHNMRDNTLVMVVSEQGNAFPFAKWTCYGNGLQSAMIVRWPGKIKPGSISDALVEYVDVTPTFVEAAGGTPDPILEGKSFLPVLAGKTKVHKSHTFGIMTTRGIINGSDTYGIRSVRDKQFRLIWNLNHQRKFTNAATKSSYFRSMVQAADAGDPRAANVVQRYQHRPEYELYDCDTDPMEMNNLADDANYATVVADLKSVLVDWMESQGDKGIQTEKDAIMHQGRYRGMTRKQAVEKYNARREGGNTKKGKRNAGKRPAKA